MSDFDPRAAFLAIGGWVGQLIAGTRPDQLDLPTPDDGWTARDLLKHIVQVEAGMCGLIAPDSPMPATEPTDETFSQVYQARLDHITKAFDEPGILERPTKGFFGELPAADVIGRFCPEFLVHGWDLAKATGQDPEGPKETSERILEASRTAIPESGRNPKAFGAPQTPPAGAGPTTKLAAWLGRTV